MEVADVPRPGGDEAVAEHMDPQDAPTGGAGCWYVSRFRRCFVYRITFSVFYSSREGRERIRCVVVSSADTPGWATIRIAYGFHRISSF